MLPISIKFQAFIPRSLGKSLLSYFENTPRFNLLSNKEEFIRKIRPKDSQGYTWLPEPGSFITKNYFATDDVEMFHHHSEHSTRLSVHMEVNPEKIGNYCFESEIFRHSHKYDGRPNFKYGGINSQHSGLSHQVQAYIKRIPFYTDMPRASKRDVYIGVCSELNTDRSDEDSLNFSVRNSKKHFYTDGGDDTTNIIVSASAEYPFLEYIAPNIDFELKIELYKNFSSKSIDISINGYHNDFPAYELIVNEEVIYSHNPADYGYTGPGIINLNVKKYFNAAKWIRLNNW